MHTKPDPHSQGFAGATEPTPATQGQILSARRKIKPPNFQKLSEHWRRQWWFFDPNHAKATTDAAFKWELIRRSDTYRQIWQAISPLTIAPDVAAPVKEGGPFAPEGWSLCASAQKSSPVVLAIRHQCSPLDRWLDLRVAQQRAIESNIALLPELDADRGVEEAVGAPGLFRIRDEIAENRKYFTPLWAADEFFMGMRESAAYKRVPAGKWLAILFDTQLSCDKLARGFDDIMLGPFGLGIKRKCQTGCFPENLAEIERLIEELPHVRSDRAQEIWRELAEDIAPEGLHPPAWDNECKDSTLEPIRALLKLVRVIPARWDPDAFCLVPAACNVALARRLFLHAVRRDKRENWLPDCRQHWNQQIAAHGKGLLPERHFSKPRTSGYRWIALAVHELGSLSMKDPATRFLCDRWLSETQSERTLALPTKQEMERRAHNELHNLHKDHSRLLELVKQSAP